MGQPIRGSLTDDVWFTGEYDFKHIRKRLEYFSKASDLLSQRSCFFRHTVVKKLGTGFIKPFAVINMNNRIKILRTKTKITEKNE